MIFLRNLGLKPFQCFFRPCQTTATVLKLGGWNFDTDPAQYGRLHRRIFFWIGPRVLGLRPNFGQIWNKITVSRQPLIRFGWHFDCKVIFESHCNLKSWTKALKSSGVEIMVAQNTDKFNVWHFNSFAVPLEVAWPILFAVKLRPSGFLLSPPGGSIYMLKPICRWFGEC